MIEVEVGVYACVRVWFCACGHMSVSSSVWCGETVCVRVYTCVCAHACVRVRVRVYVVHVSISV